MSEQLSKCHTVKTVCDCINTWHNLGGAGLDLPVNTLNFYEILQDLFILHFY